MAVRIQFRRGLSTEWTSANPILSAGEFGFETDSGNFKIGDGTSGWASLNYLAAGTITGVTAGTGLTGGGTSGSVTLSIDTSIYISPQVVDAKGDLIVGTAADTVGRLGVGSNNAVLVADSAQTSGLKWASTLSGLTLTAPTISTISNSGTLTLPTGTRTLVARDSTDTLTNKTLTAPKFADLGFIADANGNELIILDTVTSAVNEVTLANAATGNAPTLTASGGDTNVSINLVPKGTGTINVAGIPVVTTTGTQTLTNKTLTAPVISSISNLGTLTLPTTTDTLVGRATTDTLTNKTLTTPVISTISNTGTLTLPTSTDTLVGRDTTDTLTNKTITSPVVTNADITGGVVDQLQEDWNIVAAAATGTINLDVKTASIWYYTNNATANFIINARGDGSTTLSSLLAVGDSLSIAFANKNGSTSYYPTAFQIDGTPVTPRWQGGSAPFSGNSDSVDMYVYSIVKTAATPTYEVFASLTQFK